MTAAPILELSDISVRFGGVVALDGVSFGVTSGEICGLIGPNGAGKTTLFNVLSRIYDPQTGSVRYSGHDVLALAPHEVARVGIARTFQNLALWPRMSVLENVMVGAHTTSNLGVLAAMLNVGRRSREAKLRERSWGVLSSLGLESVASRPCDGLPYGTMKRVELARAVVGGASLVLLDEPAAGLTHSEVDELAEIIVELRRQHDLTILLVEHHMGMVMSISDHVVVLDFGCKIAEGTPAAVRSDPVVIEAYLGTSR